MIAQPSPGRLSFCVHAQLSHCRQLKIVLLRAVSVPVWSSSLLSTAAHIPARHAAAAGRAFRPSAVALQGLRCLRPGVGKLPPFPSVGAVWGHLGALAGTEGQAPLRPICFPWPSFHTSAVRHY